MKKNLIEKLKKHKRKLMAGAFLAGSLLVANPDYYFSECLVGARRYSELPYTELYKMTNNDSWEFIRAHGRLNAMLLNDRNGDGRVSYSEAIGW